MPSNKKYVDRLYCWVLRSTVVFWNVKRYGRILLILDGDDGSKESNAKLIRALDNVNHPLLNFRYAYEAPPKNKLAFEQKTKALGFRNYGYLLQLYSMFLMDLYTNSSIIAYTDTDAPFILPVGHSGILSKDGKLKIIGKSAGFQVKKKPWLTKWSEVTTDLLGLPMVFDYMTNFPVYLYPSTLKNCRDFITKRLKAKTFEEAFLNGFKNMLSSVNVILTYAYFHEKDRYDWHLDIEGESLVTFNKKYLLNQISQTLPQDIQPEPHYTAHVPYLQTGPVSPLELGICFLKIKLGNGTAGKHCTPYIGKGNKYPYNFEKDMDHFKSWCNGQDGMKKCEELLNQRYNDYIKVTENDVSFHADHIKKVEKNYQLYYNTTCPVLKY